MTLQRSSSPPDVELLKLQRRRTELERAIRLLEEIADMREKRPPELAALVSRASRRVA